MEQLAYPRAIISEVSHLHGMLSLQRTHLQDKHFPSHLAADGHVQPLSHIPGPDLGQRFWLGILLSLPASSRELLKFSATVLHPHNTPPAIYLREKMKLSDYLGDSVGEDEGCG